MLVLCNSNVFNFMNGGALFLLTKNITHNKSMLTKLVHHFFFNKISEKKLVGP